MALLTVHLNKRQKADNIVCQSASCMNVDYINMSRLVQAIDGCFDGIPGPEEDLSCFSSSSISGRALKTVLISSASHLAHSAKYRETSAFACLHVFATLH